MPLPSALAARLAKRGIVTKTEQKKEVEEVFVEHYDEGTEEEKRLEAELESQPSEPERIVHEKRACPNQANPYHECEDYCTKRWGFSKFDPNGNMEKKKGKMLAKYPLPPNWVEVGDPGTHRYYYWNVNTDEVSWMPPDHPRSSISLPAERLAELMDQAAAATGRTSQSSEGEESNKSESESEGSAAELEDIDMDDFEALEEKLLKQRERKDREGRGGGRGRERKKRAEALDPMDPASYSDIPRGKWSDGLPTQGDAKTGVDGTASGPLFQQRPYPSPGDILRMSGAKPPE